MTPSGVLGMGTGGRIGSESSLPDPFQGAIVLKEEFGMVVTTDSGAARRAAHSVKLRVIGCAGRTGQARSRPPRGVSRLVGMAVVLLLLGCGSTTGSRGANGSLTTVDGLHAVEIDMPGQLFIRDDHQIGSYDAFLIPEATISYNRASRRVSPALEVSFVAILEQSLIDAAEASNIPVVQEPGACVLQVGIGVTNLRIERSRIGNIGRMTVVMEFRDTISGEPLLRFAREEAIENEGTGTPRNEMLQEALDEIVADLDVSRALRAAGLSDQEVRPGCRGTLAQRGIGGLPAVSAR